MLRCNLFLPIVTLVVAFGDHVSYSMKWWEENILPFFNNMI